MNQNTEITKRENSTPDVANTVPVAAPSVDIYENTDEILLYADLPGVKKDDLTVNIDNGKLALSGLRTLESKGAAGWQEFEGVEYRRSFSVPQSIDIGKVKAELKDGILKLHLPKSEAAKPRQIEIKAA